VGEGLAPEAWCSGCTARVCLRQAPMVARHNVGVPERGRERGGGRGAGKGGPHYESEPARAERPFPGTSGTVGTSCGGATSGRGRGRGSAAQRRQELRWRQGL
jgi:hypothetical protein